MERVFFEIGRLKWVTLINVVVTLLVCLYFILKARKFSWVRGNFLWFAYFYNLTFRQVIALSFIFARVMFVFTSSIYPSDIFVGYLIVLMLLNLGFFIASKDIKMFISNIVTYLISYILLYIQGQLLTFYLYVHAEFVVMAMIVSLGLFNILAATYQSIGAYESITKKRFVNE